MEYLLFEEFLTTPNIQLATSVTFTSEDESYHMHNFYEVFYILEGDISHISDKYQEDLTVGDMILLRKSDKHMFKRTHKQFCSHRDIVISEQLFIKACNFLNPSLLDKIIFSDKYLHTKISTQKIIELENKITNLSFVPENEEVFNKPTLINAFTIELLSIFMQDFIINEKQIPHWIKVLLPRFEIPRLMQAGLPAILETINYDYSYICRTFKKYMGCNMTRYLLNIRLNYAATLLQLSFNTVANICEIIGIESIPYFTVKFKEKFGVSPREFRNKTKPVKNNRLYAKH